VGIQTTTLEEKKKKKPAQYGYIDETMLRLSDEERKENRHAGGL